MILRQSSPEPEAWALIAARSSTNALAAGFSAAADSVVKARAERAAARRVAKRNMADEKGTTSLYDFLIGWEKSYRIGSGSGEASE